MSLGAYIRKQSATLWIAASVSAYGDTSYATPITIKVRWEEREETFHDVDGSERRSKAVIFLGQDVEPDQDYLFLGISTQASPKDQAGAELVKRFKKVPAMVGNGIERRALV